MTNDTIYILVFINPINDAHLLTVIEITADYHCAGLVRNILAGVRQTACLKRSGRALSHTNIARQV